MKAKQLAEGIDQLMDEGLLNFSPSISMDVKWLGLSEPSSLRLFNIDWSMNIVQM